MKPVWRPGNRVELLENGALFFPRAFAAIHAAREEVLLETFILFDDKVGRELRGALIGAARRGVRVEMMVDGYGSPDLSDEFVGGMTEAGICFRIFGPGATWYGVRTNVFRRMHRKLLVVDGRIAFVGGINFSADHLDDFGPTAKQDYAVEIEGPVVDDIRAFLDGGRAPPRRHWYQFPRRQPARPVAAVAHAGHADVLFVTRDNQRHRNDIERQYRLGIRTARRQLVIANAYFFPGYRLLRDIRNAARRGVDVRLVLQGAPDVALATAAARWLYRYLVGGGVRIFEYCRRPLHGKVALADDEWVTVGSSNLDPLSLSLNLEANVVIRDRPLAAELRSRLFAIIEEHCTEVDPESLPPRTLWQSLWSTFVFHILRRFPAWAGVLPAHTPEVAVLASNDAAAGTSTPPAMPAEAANSPQFSPPAPPDRALRP
jgi:cardiolipin synthase A/B